MGSGRRRQSCAQATGLSRAEALSKVFFNIVVCAEDAKGSLTVHHRLSTFHVTEAPPFSFTGVDFAGPLYVRSDGVVKKAWYIHAV